MSSPPAFTATIEKIIERTPETRSFFLRLAPGRKLSFLPGQFLSFVLPIGGQTLTRAYTIASLPEEEECFEICLNRVDGGPGSSYLFSLKEAAVLCFSGPWGSFVLDRPLDTEYIFIADRVGVVPFRPMIARLLNAGGRHTARLLYAAPQATDLLYAAEWQSWERQSARFSFQPLTAECEPESYSIERALLPYIEQHFVKEARPHSPQFYICGIGRPILLLRDLLRGAGYARQAVKYEKW